MVQFTDASGMTLVAEGIETEAELESLRQLGVELGQGFLFGSPSAIAPAHVRGRPARKATVGVGARKRRRRAPRSVGAEAVP
jgi:EAL domain-containing protein (putative c-di-GMP-specific phosphodiesterase class I)